MDRFYMPAEWARHERTLIEWPVKASMVRPENYDAVCADYAGIVRAAAEFEPVTVITDEQTLPHAAALCGGAAEYINIPHNDAWFRDNGPTFVVNGAGQRRAVHWRFNAWGGRYLPCDLDYAVAPALLRHYGVDFDDSPLVLEGGSIHTDGEGTLLTTKECLQNPNRNPALSAEQIEAELCLRLGVQTVIWLNRGLDGDETDGHVDNVACFAAPGHILMQSCSEKGDPNFEITQENRAILAAVRDAAGRKIAVTEIPQPPLRMHDGQRLTLSYLNFYLVNGGLILPVFGGDAQKTDDAAKEILSGVFAGRKIRTVPCGALITEGGNAHCITQQFPRCEIL